MRDSGNTNTIVTPLLKQNLPKTVISCKTTDLYQTSLLCQQRNNLQEPLKSAYKQYCTLRALGFFRVKHIRNLWRVPSRTF